MQLTNLITVALATFATALPNPRVGVPAKSTNATLPVQPLNVPTPAVPAAPELAARNTNTTHIKRSASFPSFELANATHGVFERGSTHIGAAAPSAGAGAGSPVKRTVPLPTGFVARRAARVADLFMAKRGNVSETDALLARLGRRSDTNATSAAPVFGKRSNVTELPSVVKRSSGSNSTATFHA